MSTPRRRIKAKLARREIVAGISPDYPSPALAEMLGRSGFDLVFIDCERSGADFETIVEMSRAVRAAGAVSVLRPWSDEPGLLRRFLHCGIDGFVAPDIGSVDDVRAIRAVIADTDPPDAADIIVIGLIESRQAIEDLPAILAADGLDGIQIGLADLAVSMGLSRKGEHAEVRELALRAFALAREAGRSCGGAVNRFGVQGMLEAGGNLMMFWLNDLLRASIADSLAQLSRDGVRV